MRVAVICDYLEERWPSMDGVADSVLHSLAARADLGVTAHRVRPTMTRRFSRGDAGAGYAADRFLGRYMDYPRAVLSVRSTADVFHVVDHSYAHLVHSLPADRTVVTCHDIDTFRCVTKPPQERRSHVIRWMASRALTGLQMAARVCCDSEATFAELVGSGLMDANRVSVIPVPVHPAFSPLPDREADQRVTDLLGPPDARLPVILHVGSTIRRKRIDRLLRVFAGARTFVPARLVRVGGMFTSEQQALVRRLGLDAAIDVQPAVDVATLAAIYRRAAVVLVTSDREGFGLPLIEALACGTPVVATDLPVLREVGGDAVRYCSPHNEHLWIDQCVALLSASGEINGAVKARERGLEQAGRFGYSQYAQRMADLYRSLAA